MGERELNYLRELHRKHAHYLGKYFGFTIKDIAAYMGINRQFLSKILNGQRQLPDKWQDKFLEAFEHFGIEAKTKDFKESSEQAAIRGMWQRIKNSSKSA